MPVTVVRASPERRRSALSANLCLPYSVFVDGSANIFIADFGNSTIREVVASTGNIQTVAGTPHPGYIDGVLATSAELDLPASVVLDAAATSSSRIRSTR